MQEVMQEIAEASELFFQIDAKDYAPSTIVTSTTVPVSAVSVITTVTITTPYERGILK